MGENCLKTSDTHPFCDIGLFFAYQKNVRSEALSVIVKRDSTMALTLEKPALRQARVALTPLHRENLYKHFQWNNDPELLFRS